MQAKPYLLRMKYGGLYNTLPDTQGLTIILVHCYSTGCICEGCLV